MKIAVASQNRKSVTGHAGRRRNFWVFDIEHDEISGKTLIELPAEQSFHYASAHDPHPLDDVDVFICGGMGSGLARKLSGRGIKGLVTQEVDPERAVMLYLSGSLLTEDPHEHHPSSSRLNRQYTWSVRRTLSRNAECGLRRILLEIHNSKSTTQDEVLS